MSFFGVTKETIASVSPIEKADAIELATLVGSTFEFIIKKDQFKVGDTVLYFPIDSIIPEKILEKLGLSGRLNGSNKNRVKTVKLRGQISQGIVANIDLLGDDLSIDATSQEITDFLGVKKYEEPIKSCKTGNLIVFPKHLRDMPAGISKYDIEGCDRYPDIAEDMMDFLVEITEKIEGQNFSVTYSTADDKIYVNQRNFSIRPIKGVEHDFWRVARTQGIIDFVKSLVENVYYGLNVTVYGEFIGPGVQGNMYRLNNHAVKIFDIKVGKYWLIPMIRHQHVEKFFGNLDSHVPILGNKILLKDWLGYKTITEASNGQSKLVNKLREGIVIKTLHERYNPKIGRVILKQRDPLYLLKYSN